MNRPDLHTLLQAAHTLAMAAKSTVFVAQDRADDALRAADALPHATGRSKGGRRKSLATAERFRRDLLRARNALEALDRAWMDWEREHGPPAPPVERPRDNGLRPTAQEWATSKRRRDAVSSEPPSEPPAAGASPIPSQRDVAGIGLTEYDGRYIRRVSTWKRLACLQWARTGARGGKWRARLVLMDDEHDPELDKPERQAELLAELQRVWPELLVRGESTPGPDALARRFGR